MDVCHDCIGDSVLKTRIRREGSNQKCSFCEQRRRAVPVDTLAEWVDPVFRTHYEHGGDVPEFDDESDKVYYSQAGECLNDILSCILECDGDVANSVASSLSSNEHCLPQDGDVCFYSDEVNYTETEDYDSTFGESWSYFRDVIKYKRRFFIDGIVSELDTIFSEVHTHRTHDGMSPITTIRPGDANSTFYRARVADSDENLASILVNPKAELSAPPPYIAKAGRMNPAGISVCYGAYDRNACIVELRPPAGSRVVTGGFKICKPLNVLDLSVFNSTFVHPSIFAQNFLTVRHHIIFMRDLHAEISRPILPGDESISYVPTQVVAEYLAKKFNIGAIIYKSSQSSNDVNNIVILSKYAQCKVAPISVNYELGYHYDGGCYLRTSEGAFDDSTEYRYTVSPNYDDTKCGIEFDDGSTEVHYIESYEAKTKDSTVYIHDYQPTSKINFDF